MNKHYWIHYAWLSVLTLGLFFFATVLRSYIVFRVETLEKRINRDEEVENRRFDDLDDKLLQIRNTGTYK